VPQNASGQVGEEGLYNKALAEFNANRYSQAAAAFTELLYTYPTGRYAPNAGYWLGESLYGQNQYSDALAQFKEVISRFPRHHKAPDALFKAGLCYMRLGDKENAALQFRALAADYPHSPAATLARQRGFVR
jgi:tol-pal system protein YbgF